MRFVTRKIHSLLDYPVALSLFAMPFILGLGATHPAAKWLSVATGVAAFVLTLLTDHETGMIRMLPYRLHVAVDRLVGVTFLAAPFVLGFGGLDAAYYWANAIAVLTATVALAAPESNAPARATA